MSIKDYVVNPITKEVIFDVFRISDTYVATIVSVLKKINIRFIQGYPSATYQFCKICKKKSYDIRFICSFLCGSEGITDEQKAFFEENKISIYSWYGHSEKLIFAGYDSQKKSYDVESNYGFFELIDEIGNPVEEINALGEMIGTTFCNKYMPLIRYRTGDYGIYGGEKNGKPYNSFFTK